MPLSRAQQPAADLFRIAGAQEPSHNRNFAPAAAAANTTDKLSPRRHVLPNDLSNALKQLDDLELDRLLAATRHELQRRGALLPSEPAIQPAGDIGAHDRATVQSTTTEDSSERRQKDASAVALTRGQVNAVRAAFKAGITPSRIARQFGISQSDVRKVLASEFRRSGRR
jgi:hypothetical protein